MTSKNNENNPVLIEAGLNLFTALFSMVNKALPGEAERLEKLKLKSPLLYERYMNRIISIRLRRLRKVKRTLGISIDDETLLKYLTGQVDTATAIKVASERK